MKYIKPEIKTKRINLNMFLSDRSRDSFSLPLVGPVFAQSGGGCTGCGTGGSDCGTCTCACACSCGCAGAGGGNGSGSCATCGCGCSQCDCTGNAAG